MIKFELIKNNRVVNTVEMMCEHGARDHFDCAVYHAVKSLNDSAGRAWYESEWVGMTCYIFDKSIDERIGFYEIRKVE